MSACPTCGKEYSDLKVHLNQSYPEHLPEEWQTCHECGKWYSKLGAHWSMSDCEYPNMSRYQHEIITGILMGDGWIDKDKKHPRLSVSVTEKEYLGYVHRELDILSNGVKLKETAESNSSRKSRPKENYNDLYRLSTICHPSLEQYENWYNSGKKVWPDNIKMTPIILKHWYCCDGHYKDTNGDNYITISMSNEVDNTDKIGCYFSNKNLPSPAWQFGESKLDGQTWPRCIARWTVDQSEKLFNYMGEPVPGYEYKWPDRLNTDVV